MTKRSSTRFNCFSPPVMLATFIIEATLACYAVWRYKMTALTRLVFATLLALATFQLAEYFVCTGSGAVADTWSRVGFVAITTLPVFNLHILHKIAHKSGRRLLVLAYGTMAAFIIFFLAYSSAFVGHKCTGNYVIFQIGDGAAFVYGLYYYGWILAGMGLGLTWADKFKAQGEKGRKKLEAIWGLIAGYLVFLVPTAIANSVVPSSRDGIPSILCGFAVLFALVLTLYVLPRAAAHRSRS